MTGSEVLILFGPKNFGFGLIDIFDKFSAALNFLRKWLHIYTYIYLGCVGFTTYVSTFESLLRCSREKIKHNSNMWSHLVREFNASLNLSNISIKPKPQLFGPIRTRTSGPHIICFEVDRLIIPHHLFSF